MPGLGPHVRHRHRPEEHPCRRIVAISFTLREKKRVYIIGPRSTAPTMARCRRLLCPMRLLACLDVRRDHWQRVTYNFPKSRPSGHASPCRTVSHGCLVEAGSGPGLGRGPSESVDGVSAGTRRKPAQFSCTTAAHWHCAAADSGESFRRHRCRRGFVTGRAPG